ncbi:MAG: TonB family protein [Bacteroidota bacterium]
MAVSAGLEQFFIDINGPREAGKPLNFTIENYSSSVAYTLDFGNGERRRMRREISYTYPAEGNYTIRLFASQLGKKTSVYRKRLAVSTNAGNTSESIAENTPEGGEEDDPEGTARSIEIRDEIAETGLLNTPEAPQLAEASVQPPSLTANAGEQTAAPSTEAPTSGNSGIASANATEEAESSSPYIATEIPPQYVGGRRSMIRFLRRNSRYPNDARSQEVEGDVLVRFVVQADGSLSNIKVIKGVGHGCDEEAIRLVQMMPRWIPGKVKGEPVPAFHTMPISFRLL